MVLLEKLSSLIRKNYTSILLLGIIFGLFLLNSRYVDYPDEYINLLGGKVILNGGLPYRDFWDHHLPLAWYISSIFLFLSGKSFVLTRVLWAVAQFGGFALLGRWIYKKHPSLVKPFLAFFVLYPAASLYFWFHLFLADSLAVFFFSIAFWILLAETFDNKSLGRSLFVSSFFVFCMIMSSATFLYMVAVLYLWHAYLYKFKVDKKLLSLIAWSILPYGIFVLNLFLTKTWNDFYFANFVYNTKYYISIPNYVRGPHFNPFKFSWTIISNFSAGYLPLLTKIKYLDLYLPIGTLAGISTLTLFFFLFAKNWFLGLMYFLVLSFSAPRSGLQDFKETDYQSSMFLVLGLISSVFVLWLFSKAKIKPSPAKGSVEAMDDWLSDLHRVVRLITLIFFIFTGIFLLVNSFNTAYKIYTQKLPTIHNAGPAATFIDEVLDQGDYYFIGPYEPNESFYVKKGVWVGKHPSLLPQFREGDELRDSYLKQFSEHPPRIFIFKQSASIFQTPALEFGKFFLDWAGDKYTRLEKVKGVEVLRNPTGVDLKGDLYIKNTDLKSILLKLQDLGYISF